MELSCDRLIKTPETTVYFSELIKLGWTDNSISKMLNNPQLGWSEITNTVEDPRFKGSQESLREKINQAADRGIREAVNKVFTDENSGGACDYYRVDISAPVTKSQIPYIAECLDIAEALNMTVAEFNIFKEVWRSAASRTLGKKKAGHTELRGADKICFFGERNRIQKGGK
jgi:hypothetical protein